MVITKNMREKITQIVRKGVYTVIRALVELFYPKPEIVGEENLPEEPCILVGNHAQMNGPIIAELYLPGEPVTWCVSQMMNLKEVPAYAYRDFWSEKPALIRPLYRLLSFIIAPLADCLFNAARTIPVYRDARLITTMRKTMETLEGGKSVVIFPEKNEEYNHILYAFERNFVDVARLTSRKYKKELSFVPFYNAPRLKKVLIGKPVRFRADAPIEQERTRICSCLAEEITAMAGSLPEHTVIPYRNIPKKDYPLNRPAGADLE